MFKVQMMSTFGWRTITGGAFASREQAVACLNRRRDLAPWQHVRLHVSLIPCPDADNLMFTT